MPIYFSKELCSNKLFFKNTPVPFECQPTNTGCIALDDEKDKELVAFLNDMIAKRKGGVSLIDEAAYEAIKKNKTGRVSAAYSPKDRLQVLKVPSPLGKPKDAEVVAAKNPVRAATGTESIDSIPADASAPFVPRRGRVLNEADKTKPPG